MNKKPTGIPRYLPFAGPALFRQGFRPFFFGSGLWALVSMGLWLLMSQGHLSIPTHFDLLDWHVHEMLFGYLAAAIAGFLLTAIPNWTGRMPLQGLPLVFLFGVWLLGRLAVSLSDFIGADLTAALDLSFLAVLLAAVSREIVAGKNWRNLPMAVALAGMLAANGLAHADTIGLLSTSGLGYRLAIAIAISLISLIGGRIIPSFTHNWLKKRGARRMPAEVGRLDQMAILILIVGLGVWVAIPDTRVAAGCLLAAGFANAIRLSRWRWTQTLSEPLVWSLHLAFAWIPVGLVLMGLSAFLEELPASAGLHGLTAGAIGSTTLAVMTRATLGHAGRDLLADRWTIAIYAAVGAAAASRVAAPIFSDVYVSFLWTSGILWIAAFGLFTLHYGYMLLFPR